jgi:hypothetical protein
MPVGLAAVKTTIELAIAIHHSVLVVLQIYRYSIY